MKVEYMIGIEMKFQYNSTGNKGVENAKFK